MGSRYEVISAEHQSFIEAQPVFFVATAASDGLVNLSPKGMDSLRVLSSNRVIWLNSTGSGNETAAHLLENPRMTVMFCAFEGQPLILRLYGTAKAVHPRDAGWLELASLFPEIPGARQIFDLRVDAVLTSCGMAVPLMDFRAPREQLSDHWREQGKDGLEAYWKRKNLVSLDGKPTGLLED
jgi:Pyridoxamine 5'-phosphate oxidase